MAAAGNSTQCIQRAACLPLGGHSVWAALPPLPADAGADARPLLLVLAGADGDALFHNRIRVRAGAGTRPRSSPRLTHAGAWQQRGAPGGPGGRGAAVGAGGDAGGGRGARQRERGGQLHAPAGVRRAGGRALGPHGLAAPAVPDARGRARRARPGPGRRRAGARRTHRAPPCPKDDSSLGRPRPQRPAALPGRDVQAGAGSAGAPAPTARRARRSWSSGRSAARRRRPGAAARCTCTTSAVPAGAARRRWWPPFRLPRRTRRAPPR